MGILDFIKREICELISGLMYCIGFLLGFLHSRWNMELLTGTYSDIVVGSEA